MFPGRKIGRFSCGLSGKWQFTYNRGRRNMSIVLTNGKYFIARDEAGKIVKVRNKSEAQNFHSVKRAVDVKKKCCGKTKGYYVFDTELDICRVF